MKQIEKNKIYILRDDELLKIYEKNKENIENRWLLIKEKLENGELKENLEVNSNWNDIEEQEKERLKKKKIFGMVGEYMIEEKFKNFHVNRLSIGKSDIIEEIEEDGKIKKISREVKSINAKGSLEKFEKDINELLFKRECYLQHYQMEKVLNNKLFIFFRFDDGIILLKSNKKIKEIIKYAKQEYRSPKGTELNTYDKKIFNYIFQYRDMFMRKLEE